MRISDWSSDVCSSDLCPYCGVGCQTTVHVKDDKILYIDGRDGPANQNRLCVKGRFGWDYIYSPHRLTKPMIRRDDAPKRWNDQVDQTGRAPCRERVCQYV